MRIFFHFILNPCKVWLLYNDGPAVGLEAVLPFFNMERPVGIEVSTQVDGPELHDSLSHFLGPSDPQTFHPVRDKILARSLERTTGDGPAVGEIFVIGVVSPNPERNTGRLLYRIQVPVTVANVYESMLLGQSTGTLGFLKSTGVTFVDLSSLSIGVLNYVDLERFRILLALPLGSPFLILLVSPLMCLRYHALNQKLVSSFWRACS